VEESYVFILFYFDICASGCDRTAMYEQEMRSIE